MNHYTWQLVVHDEPPTYDIHFRDPAMVMSWLRTRSEFKDLREHFWVITIDTPTGACISLKERGALEASA